MDRKEELFNSLNGYFDQIYVITLKRSKDRHSYIKELLKELNYQIFWGVDGSDLNIEKITDEGLYDPNLSKEKSPTGEGLVPGEIGCALSHLEVYKDILKEGYKNALILEDDITLDPEFRGQLTQSLEELPENWELLYLGCSYYRTKISFSTALRIRIFYPILFLIGFKKYNPKKLRYKYPRPYSNNLDLAGWHFGSYAYAVTASAAEKILTAQTPVCLAADNAIGKACVDESIKAFRIKRRVFNYKRDFSSTIKGRFLS